MRLNYYQNKVSEIIKITKKDTAYYTNYCLSNTYA